MRALQRRETQGAKAPLDNCTGTSLVRQLPWFRRQKSVPARFAKIADVHERHDRKLGWRKVRELWSDWATVRRQCSGKMRARDGHDRGASVQWPAIGNVRSTIRINRAWQRGETLPKSSGSLLLHHPHSFPNIPAYIHGSSVADPRRSVRESTFIGKSALYHLWPFFSLQPLYQGDGTWSRGTPLAGRLESLPK